MDMTDPVPDLYASVCRIFDEQALPSLSEFVKIENLSPAFDTEGKSVAEVHNALQHFSDWAKDNAPEGTQISKLVRVQNAPMLIVDIPGTADGTILCFGHLDKYPAGEDWNDGLSAYMPVLRDQKLYGRGTVDGGFAPYCYVSAAMSLAELGVPRPRCLIAVEMSYESHGIHLARYLPDLRSLCDKPDLIISLDAICADYERLWYSTGYRGVIEGHLTVEMLDKPAHSGAVGMAPSALGIAFDLLGRVADLPSGLITLDGLKPRKRLDHITTEGSETDAIAGRCFLATAGVTRHVPGLTDQPERAAMLPVWNASLTVAGIEGLSAPGLTGGVLPPSVTLKIGVRTPPGVDCAEAATELEQALVESPPYNATVDFSPTNMLPGWYPDPLPEWLTASARAASTEFFGNPAVGWFIGGAYPEIEIIAQEFAETPMLVSGIMGPNANFHIANEALDLPAARKMTASIAQILADLPPRN
jgi:acetylornithine deacetylase/succinyl-diaminopimelate desuccinylase-like protein